MAKTTTRTLIAEYVLKDDNGNPLKDDAGNTVRKQAGVVVELSQTAFRRAIDAGVVYEDDARNEEVPVRQPDAPENDAAGQNRDESRGSGPAADRGIRQRGRGNRR